MLASDGPEGAGWWRRLQLRLHLLICRHCRGYARQMRRIGETLRSLWSTPGEEQARLERLARGILDVGERDDR
jgi:hypothetical protein